MPGDGVKKYQPGHLGYQQGPAISMDVNDHKNTTSYGRKPGADDYREKLTTFIESGNYRGAMATEIQDVRRVARNAGDPTRYNEAMREMLTKGDRFIFRK